MIRQFSRHSNHIYRKAFRSGFYLLRKFVSSGHSEEFFSLNLKSGFFFNHFPTHSFIHFIMSVPFSHFASLDIRTATITAVEDFPEARKPAWKLTLDVGPEIGTLRSSAQITALYTKEDLIGRQVLAVVNFPPKQIGPFVSECLVLGVYGEGDDVILIQPDRTVPNGWPLG